MSMQMFRDVIRLITRERLLRIWGSSISAGQTRYVTLSDNKTVHENVCQTQRCFTLLRPSGTAGVKLGITSTLQQTG